MSSLFLGGLLRLHGADIARLQRVLDPLLTTLLFVLLLGPEADRVGSVGSQAWSAVALATALLLSRGGLYRSYRQKSLFTLARRVTTSWLTVLTALLLLAFLSKTSASFSRLDASVWALSCWLLLLAHHVGLRKLLRWHRQRGGNRRTVLYWGMPEAALAFADQLQQNPWLGLQVAAWFSPVPISADDHLHICLPRCGGGLGEMRRWLDRHRVDRIVFSHVNRDEISMEQVLSLFGDTSLPVIYAPHWAQTGMVFRVDQIGSQPCIDIWGTQESLFNRQLKRGFDLVLASAGLLLLSPLLLAIAVAVACSSPGPILFSQDRYGLDGRRFRIHKFRTMRVQESGDTPGLRQATRNDPRVTPVGRFLRRWSLDELPQLLNVLKGEMSLVGPRPHAVDHNEHYRRLIPGYMQRHTFKPGITGLAQVKGWRGETSTVRAMANRVEADLCYVRDWSLKLDVKILVKTLLRLRSPNAY